LSFYTHDNLLSLFTYSPLYTIYTLLAAEKRDTRSYREKRISNTYTQTPTCSRSLASIRGIRRYFYCSILLRSSYTSLSIEAAAECSKRATILRRRLLVYLRPCYVQL